MFGCKIKQLFDRFSKYHLLETSLHLCPLVLLRLAQFASVSREILVQCGEQKYVASWCIDYLGKLLEEIQFFLWVVLSCMFQHLAKLINSNQQELVLLLQFGVISLQER